MTDVENVARFARLFRGNQSHHYTADIRRATKNEKGKLVPEYRKVPAAPTLAAYDRHLRGELGLLVVPVTEDGRCWFAAIDVDDYQLDHAALIARVKRRGLPLVLTVSKSGGAHLYWFAKAAPAPAQELRERLCGWAADLGYAAVEIFPKHDRLDPGQDGNGINLPYFGAQA